MTIEKRVGVGVALLVLKEDEKLVLLGKRIGSHGNGTWGAPGGKLNYLETAKEGCLRELTEETGLVGSNIEMIDDIPCATTEYSFSDGLHFVTLYLRSRYLNGVPKVMEPKECSQWKFYPWTRLPSNLFLPMRNLIAQGYNPFRGLK